MYVKPKTVKTLNNILYIIRMKHMLFSWFFQLTAVHNELFLQEIKIASEYLRHNKI